MSLDVDHLETFVVAPAEYEVALSHFLAEHLRNKMIIELVTVNDYVGTLDALRAVRDRIRGDVFCFSADYLSQFSLADMANLHRTQASDLTMIFSIPPKEMAIKDDVDQEYVGISEDGRLLIKVPALEIDEDGVEIPKPLLHKAASFSLRKDLLDMGVYLLSYWLVEFLVSDANGMKMSSLRSDLVPYLVKRQFQPSAYLLEAMPALNHRKRPLKALESWIGARNMGLINDDRFQTIFEGAEEENPDLLRCYGLVYDHAAVLGTNAPGVSVAAASSGSASGQSSAAAGGYSVIHARLSNIQSYLALNK